ncbi:MAG TPA: hypothetical protein VHN39_00980 [Phenylobacterium sp.]|jgi:hypothetical protein|nr:hypothetical protein [Phenylobacterium sp.]
MGAISDSVAIITGCTLARAPDLEVYPDDFAPDRAGAWVEW